MAHFNPLFFVFRSGVLFVVLMMASSPGMPILQAAEGQLADPAVKVLPDRGLKDLPSGRNGAAIRYGYELLLHTPDYLGPRGKISHNTKSRMSCGNCHLDVGTRPLGNSWLDSHALYPQYRAREGRIQTLADRVNTCLEVPLQGKPLRPDSPEMQSILLYIKWIGRSRPILDRDPDLRMAALPLLSRAAEPAAGREIFENRCASCHGQKGQGRLTTDDVAFVYPPLWGPESYRTGSSMSRLSLLARFVKSNMPYSDSSRSPSLTDNEAWDVAAYINSQDRPSWSGKSPFADPLEKPFDFPLGPYRDGFSDAQHRLGPFKPIQDFLESKLGKQPNSSGI